MVDRIEDAGSRPGSQPIARVVRHGLVLVAVLQMAVGIWVCPRLPQDPGYHQMADQRTLLGMPNCLNVLSNLPFLMVGCFGLVATLRRRPGAADPFAEPWLRWPYAALFTGAVLTAFGSSYYHLAPDNWRLVWDRLPMTLAFMGLLTAIIGERASTTAAKLAFGPLLLLGAASVGYWYWSEQQGMGDLRPYVLVQFGSLVVIVLLLFLYPSRAQGARYLIAGLVAYAAAKALEQADELVFRLTHLVSGHTLKHLAAVTAVGCVAMMIHMAPRGRPREGARASGGARAA